MKLFYWDGQPNFGDQLNPWLWSKLAPELFEQEGDAYVIGLGTLLNSRVDEMVPRDKMKVVFGTGAGYGSGPPVLSSHWNIRCVRGPLTARLLGLSADLAVCDPAILVSDFVSPVRQTGDVTFMPHWRNRHPHWETICGWMGVIYLDPFSPLPAIFEQIGRSRLVLAEAMHAAIAADTLRVPWISLAGRTQDQLRFKWEDWCAAINVSYEPWDIPCLADAKGSLSGTKPIGEAARCLRRARKRGTPQLSDETRLRYLRSRLWEQLEALRSDFIRGRFH